MSTCTYMCAHIQTHTHTLAVSLARERLGLLKGRNNSSRLRIKGWSAKEVRGKEKRQQGKGHLWAGSSHRMEQRELERR